MAERRFLERRISSRGGGLRERRSGFDNRGHDLTGLGAVMKLPYRAACFLRQDRRRIILVLLLINGFNLADYFLTLQALALGHREANPFMRFLLAADPLLAAGVKVAAGLLTTLVIWHYRRYRLMLQFALLILGMYGLLVAYHVIGPWCLNIS